MAKSELQGRAVNGQLLEKVIAERIGNAVREERAGGNVDHEPEQTAGGPREQIELCSSVVGAGFQPAGIVVIELLAWLRPYGILLLSSIGAPRRATRPAWRAT